MSSGSRTPSFGPDHSEDRSYNSDDSDASPQRWFTDNSVDSSGSRNSPQSRDEDRLVRSNEGAEVDPLANKPLVSQRDGSNAACEPPAFDEMTDPIQNQSARVLVPLDPVYDSEAIKISRCLMMGRLVTFSGRLYPIPLLAHLRDQRGELLDRVFREARKRGSDALLGRHIARRSLWARFGVVFTFPKGSS